MLPSNRRSFNRPKFRFNRRTKLSSKQYSNPFFNKKKKSAFASRNFVSMRTRAIIFIVVVILLAGAWFFLYSRYFTIKNVAINDQGRISTDAIRAVVDEQMAGSKFVFLPQTNIFLFNTAGLKARLQDKYSFDNLSISKKLPSTLKVSLVEKQYAFIWQEDNNYYYLDSSGDIITGTNVLDIKDKAYPLINNLSNQKITNNKVQADTVTLQFIVNLFNKLKNYTNEFKVTGFTIDNDLFTVKARVENGPQIYFSTQADIDNQIERVILLKKEQLKSDFFKKEYINVKVQDRVYYR
jgi:cell division septal protein FtsQ